VINRPVVVDRHPGLAGRVVQAMGAHAEMVIEVIATKRHSHEVEQISPGG
jgi:hypothetical protein